MGWSALSGVVASFFVRLPLAKMVFLVGASAIPRDLGEHDSLPVLSGLELDGVITSGFTFFPLPRHVTRISLPDRFVFPMLCSYDLPVGTYSVLR